MGLSAWAKGRKNLETPGPGAYSPPAPFGSGPHYSLRGRVKERDPDPEPAIVTLPSTLVYRTTSFGFRPKEKKPDITPGPERAVAVPIGSEAPKYSFRIKQDDPPNRNPGPGDYDISREFVSPQQTISTGRRWDAIDANIIADPGKYGVPRTLDKPKKKTIGRSIPIPEPERNGPGPAKYAAKTHIGRDNAGYTISRSPRDRKPNSNPGPADYQRMRPLTSESALGTTIKNKTPLPHGDICDYPYHNYPGCIVPKKFTHGTRPATSYETISPGPIYDKPPAIEHKQITIGERRKTKVQKSPGPADYFKTPITPKPMPPCGFYGPTDRCPVNTEKEKQKPGPADYEKVRDFDKFERGYYFTTRKMDDFVPDTAGPYVGPTSSLGGPKWTIGSKDA